MNNFRCKHFNGTLHDVCLAGVVYDDVRNKKGRFGEENRLPCVDRFCPMVCEKKELYTEEEIAAQEAEVARWIVGIFTVRPLILEDVGEGRKKEYVQGDINCPVCGEGRVNYSFHGHVNGHVHGKCETAGCVEWIE